LNASVVVLTYNGRRWVEACLDSVLKAGVDARAVFVVDNASADGTPDLVRTAFPGVRLIAAQRNLGFAAGCNVGIRAALEAGFDSVALLNQDTRVAPDCFLRLDEAAQAESKAGIFAPLQFTYDGAGIDPSQRQGILAGIGDFLDDLWHGRLKSAYPADAVYGGAVLVHRSVFERIGLFDETFFLYGEDEDFCRRARRSAVPIWLVPHAHVFHWHTIVQGDREQDPAIAAHVRRARLVLALKDPDRAWAGRCLYAARALAASALSALARMEPGRAAASIRDACWLLRRVAAIKKSRDRDLAIQAARTGA